MNPWFKLTFSVLGALSGCSPLQQAPLVYSSKVIVGVDVSANASESPGAAISIGVKSVDAAYVPVAVSKKIDTSGIQTETKTHDEIMRIFAEYGSGDSDPATKSLTEANKAKIVSYLEAWKAQNEAQSNARAAKDLYERSQTKLAQLKSLAADISVAKPKPGAATSVATGASAPAVADNGVPDRVSSFNKRLINVAPDVPQLVSSDSGNNFDDVLANINNSILDFERELSLQKTKAETAQKDLDVTTRQADERFVAAAQAASLVNTQKTDALSVYGRFDSNGSATAGDSGQKATGSVLVGKVFSTGLASQNLTEAVKIEVRSKCFIEALKMAESLAGDERTKFLEKIDQFCPDKNDDR